MKKRLFFFICLSCFFVQSQRVILYAQENFSTRYNITYITMNEGLLHNFIDDLYKDKQGFLWVSTGGGGLSRYDGYEFIHYNTNTSPVKLKSNFIRNVCEDDYGRLWIVSEGGINILDLSTLRETTPKDFTGKYADLTGLPAIRVVKDSKGCIWICSGDALYKISFRSEGDIAEIYTLSSIPLLIKEIDLKDIDNDGNIWVGFGNTVCKLYEDKRGLLKAVPVASCLRLEDDIFISAFQMKENEVWIGTDRGLIRYDKSKEIIKRYVYERNNRRSLSQNHVTDLVISSDKQLIVSTLKGINIYNPITDDFEHITSEEVSMNSKLNSNFINCLLIDKDIVWMGSETGGINKMTPRKLSIHSYVHSKEDKNSLSDNPVNAIYEDSDGYLWVGTVEGGLNRKSPNSDRFSHYTVESSSRLSHNSVSAITSDNQGYLWVGTWGDGITVLERERPERPAIKYISAQTHPGFPVNFIGFLCYDSINNGMWIGCNQGIFFYEPATDRIISPFPVGVTQNIYGAIGSVIDPNGWLWAGCMEGMYMIDLNSRSGDSFSYHYLRYKLDEPNSNLIEKISCFYLTNDGTLWIGSNGYGIYKFIPEDNGFGHFISYTTMQGLINNTIRGILEDDFKRLWISTNNGLSCFNPSTGRFTNYTTKDGLTDIHFYWNAYCRSKSGLLYFGALTGLTVINANRYYAKDISAKVTLTKLRVAYKEIFSGDNYIDKDISVARTLHLHESDKSFSLEFSALNFESQASAVYCYRLLGFDEDWVSVSDSRRFAAYTNLPPGKYTFQVKYIPEEASVDLPPAELEVIIRPFFYKTSWFILLLLLLTGFCGVYLYRMRIRSLKKQKELLHRTVEERTHELKKQKQQLIDMSKRVQELTIDKLSFFTNITHEFRTPLTLIIGPIDKALKLSSNPQVIEQLHFVERNSKYLLSLVNQLMDFRKVESGKLEIVRTSGDFLQFIDSLIVPFEVFAKERNIQIRKFYRMIDPEILFDQDAMQKVITNLLSNAVKFTPDRGTVSIYVASCFDRETKNENLFLSIKDTGTGIAKEDITMIFNRFYQSRNNVKFPMYGQSGTGIGLYLSKQIVKTQGGRINVKNNRKNGSTFYITLPLMREKSNLNPKKDAVEIFPADSHKQKQEHFVSAKPTVLIVEDNQDMRSYIHSILSEQYNIFEAGNGEEALAILSDRSADFIISDLMMPVMDGMELSRKVKENFTISHIPFLMLTAKTNQESRIESYRIGVDEYLLKPFSEELLLARIHNILENRKRYQQQFKRNMDINTLQMDEESRDKKFINKALEIIKANYKNAAYESGDFIDAMGISKSLLNKKLQSLIGQSIGQFIRNYRLNIARELIIQNRFTQNLNISEIAYEVGFNDPKYFTRCFTKRFNITPSSLLNETDEDTLV